MRTSTYKQSQPQKPVSSGFVRPNMATLGPDHREHPIVHLPRTIGHDFCLVPIRHPAAGPLQAKLAIGKSGNEYTQEADAALAIEHGTEPLPTALRSQFGPRFEHDFSRVRIHADGEAVREAAERGTSSSGGSLPHLTEIQSSFGRHDVSHVSAHQGSRAAAAARAIGARAYTIGDHVAFAGAPDLHTAAHEAAHVVQQSAGVQLAGNVGKAGDVYEQHADAVADLVVNSRSAETLLDQMAPAKSRALGVQRQMVQRTPIKTDYGDFDTTKYDKVGPSGSEYGVDIVLTFDPDSTKVDAKKIGLTQTARSQLAGAAIVLEPSRRSRVVPSGTGEGREIDRTTMGAYGNPLYAAGVPSATDKLGDTPTVAGWGQHGWNYKDSSGSPQHQIAKLIDRPTLPGHGNNAAQTFETAALAVEGTQSGTYMGSVSWGWSVDGAGKFSKLPLTLVSKGTPSAGFVAAAKQWNKWTTAGTIKTTPYPTNVYDASYSVAFTVAKDTEVEVTGGSYIHGDLPYSPVNIKSGPDIGKSGRIKVADLRDVGGGNPVIKLPIP